MLAAAVAGGVAFWLARRRRRGAVGGITEAVCPACLTLAYLAEHGALLKWMVNDLRATFGTAERT